MKKTVKVIMLPTEKVSPIFIDNNKIIFDENLITIDSKDEYSEELQPQHLYLVSDEEIKEGDYCVSYMPTTKGIVYEKIFQAKKIEDKDDEKMYFDDESGQNCVFKVIATTDNSLKIPDGKSYGQECPLGISNDDGLTYIPLPQVPESFINDFVESEGKIYEVQVEYEQRCKMNHKCIFLEDYDGEKKKNCCLFIKTNQENEIIIHGPEKAMTNLVNIKSEMRYTKEEVVELLKKAHGEQISWNGLDSWIEENL